MSDEDLLRHAEAMLGYGDNTEDGDDALMAYVQSIAASNLVIARNSVQINEQQPMASVIPHPSNLLAPAEVDLTSEIVKGSES